MKKCFSSQVKNIFRLHWLWYKNLEKKWQPKKNSHRHWWRLNFYTIYRFSVYFSSSNSSHPHRPWWHKSHIGPSRSRKNYVPTWWKKPPLSLQLNKDGPKKGACQVPQSENKFLKMFYLYISIYVWPIGPGYVPFSDPARPPGSVCPAPGSRSNARFCRITSTVIVCKILT